MVKDNRRSLMIAVAIRFAWMMPALLAGLYLLVTESRWGVRAFWAACLIFWCFLAAYWAWTSVHNVPAPKPLSSRTQDRWSGVCFWLLIAMTAGALITLVWVRFNPDAMEMLRRPLISPGPVPSPPNE